MCLTKECVGHIWQHLDSGGLQGAAAGGGHDLPSADGNNPLCAKTSNSWGAHSTSARIYLRKWQPQGAGNV